MFVNRRVYAMIIMSHGLFIETSSGGSIYPRKWGNGRRQYLDIDLKRRPRLRGIPMRKWRAGSSRYARGPRMGYHVELAQTL